MQNLWKLSKLFKHRKFIVSKLILNFKSKDSKKIKHPINFLGGKWANLAEMGKLGLPVPPGFTISTKACDLFYNNNKKLNQKILFLIFLTMLWSMTKIKLLKKIV